MFNKGRGKKAFVPPKLMTAGGTQTQWGRTTPVWRGNGAYENWIAGGWFKNYNGDGGGNDWSASLNLATQPFANTTSGYGAVRVRWRGIDGTNPEFRVTTYRAGLHAGTMTFAPGQAIRDRDQWFHVIIFSKTRNKFGIILNGKYFGDLDHSGNGQVCYPQCANPDGLAVNIFGQRYGGAPYTPTYPNMTMYNYFLSNMYDYEKSGGQFASRGVVNGDPTTYANPWMKNEAGYMITPVTLDEDSGLVSAITGTARALMVTIDQGEGASKATVVANSNYTSAGAENINPSNNTFEELPVYGYDLREAN